MYLDEILESVAQHFPELDGEQITVTYVELPDSYTDRNITAQGYSVYLDTRLAHADTQEVMGAIATELAGIVLGYFDATRELSEPAQAKLRDDFIMSRGLGPELLEYGRLLEMCFEHEPLPVDGYRPEEMYQHLGCIF